jgi:peptide/nickel transport system substrate-binding protein
MCREAPVAFLWAQPFTYVLSNRIDWKPRGDEWIRATDMRLR